MKNLTEEEKQMLEALENTKGYTALQLRPPIGLSIIRPTGNRAYINEGRKGEFYNISESFYDEMVDKFDTRHKKRIL